MATILTLPNDVYVLDENHSLTAYRASTGDPGHTVFRMFDREGHETVPDPSLCREILRLAEENKRLRRFVAEWSERFGFLATQHPRDSFESIDEVAHLLRREGECWRAALALAETGLLAAAFDTGAGGWQSGVKEGYEIPEVEAAMVAIRALHVTPPALEDEEPPDTSPPASRD